MTTPANNQSDLRRWFSKITFSVDGCWNWSAGSCNGYGWLYISGKGTYAHRFSFETFKENLISGMVVDHLCRNHRCVNPAHLEQITIGENVLRGESAVAERARQTHCKNGHKLSITFIGNETTRKRRRCLQCVSDYNKRYAATHSRNPATP